MHNKYAKIKNRAKGFVSRYAQKFSDSVVIGSIFALSAMQFAEGTKPHDVDYGNKFPIDNTTFTINATYQGHALQENDMTDTYRLVKYNVDTVVIDTAYLKNTFRSFASADQITNELTINHFVVDTTGMPKGIKNIEQQRAKRYNSPKNIYFMGVHEGAHQENADQGLKDYGIFPTQYAKICIHDELIANISELLEIREDYLKSGNIESLNSQYDFYRQAVLNKEISPDYSKVPDDKEMSLIINGMMDWWMSSNSEYYEKKQISATRNWMRRGFKHNLYERIKPGDINKRRNHEYMKRLHNGYSFKISIMDSEGVKKSQIINFLPYMTKDVEVSQKFKDAVAAESSLSFETAYDQYKKSKDDAVRIKVEAASRVKDTDATIVKDRNLSKKSFRMEKTPPVKITSIRQNSR